MSEKHKAAFDAKEQASDAIYNAIKTKVAEVEEELSFSAYEVLLRIDRVNDNTEHANTVYNALREAFQAGQELGQMLSWGSSSWGGNWVSDLPTKE